MNKDQEVLKEISEEFKTLTKQMNIKVVTPSYMINEIEHYLKENNITMIIARCDRVINESSFKAVY